MRPKVAGVPGKSRASSGSPIRNPGIFQAVLPVGASRLGLTRRGSYGVRRIILNNGILLVQYGASALVPLLLVPHIVHSIGVNAYGEIAVAVAWANLAATVIRYAFHLTGPKRVAQSGGQRAGALVFAEILGAKLLLLLLILVTFVAALCVAPNLRVSNVQGLVLLALSVGAALDSSWYLQVRDRFLWICVPALVGTITSLWIGFGHVSDTDAGSIWAAGWALVISPLFLGCATLVVAVLLVARSRFRWRAVRPIGALREGWPLFASQLVAALYGIPGPIVISGLVGVAEAGAYSAVERLINGALNACLLTHTAAYPRLASLYVQDRAAYWKVLKSVVVVYLCITSLIALVAWVFRDLLIVFLFGRNDVPDAELLIAWGLVWLMLGVFGTAVTGYMTVSGRSPEVIRLNLKVLGVASVLGLVGTWTLGAWAWMASLVASRIVVLRLAYRYWRLEHAN